MIAIGAYSISGASGAHINVGTGASAQIALHTITLTGTPAFSGAFAKAFDAGTLNISGCTFTGSATGPRYSATGNGVIDTAGAGATYLPGNAGGSVATGGQYI